VQSYPHGAVNFEGKKIMEGTEKDKSTGKLERELPVPCARGQLER
jgi:hypothetical protein